MKEIRVEFSDFSSKKYVRQAKVGPILASLALAFAIFSSGCATTSAGANFDRNSVEALIIDADSELAHGRSDNAISVLSYAAKVHPAHAMPWLRIATIWFDKGNYPSAIVAANEAIQRDPGNQEAKSLLVVAGLRVAASAVTELRPTGAVNTATRAEAESLTNSLRSALGEKVLVPGGETKPRSQLSRAKPASAGGLRGLDVPAASIPVTATIKQAPPGAASPDPFRSLK